MRSVSDLTRIRSVERGICPITAHCRPIVVETWRFYVGTRGTAPNLAQAPKFLIGSIVISLSRCCLPNDEGPGPQIFFS